MNSSNSDNKKIVGVDRSSARLSAVQALYEIDMTGVSADPVLLEFLKDRWKFHSELTKDDQENCPHIATPNYNLLTKIIRCVSAKQNEIDQIIRPSLSDELTIERLEVILRAILRAGTFELITFAKVPAKVIINEYVNVARAFFDDNKPSLVNGVLDKISRVVRNAEMKNLSD